MMSVYIFDALAVLLCVGAASVFYLGCPNQQWLSSKVLGFYPALCISFLLVMLAWCLLRFHMSALSTSFTILTVLMFLLGLLPFFTRFTKPQLVDRSSKSSITKTATAANYQPHWWLRTLGVLLLGYPLAVGLSGLFAVWGPGEMTHDVKSQLVMWMITPLWLLPLSVIYFVRTVMQILVALLGLNLFVYFMLWLARSGV